MLPTLWACLVCGPPSRERGDPFTPPPTHLQLHVPGPHPLPLHAGQVGVQGLVVLNKGGKIVSLVMHKVTHAAANVTVKSLISLQPHSRDTETQLVAVSTKDKHGCGCHCGGPHRPVGTQQGRQALSTALCCCFEPMHCSDFLQTAAAANHALRGLPAIRCCCCCLSHNAAAASIFSKEGSNLAACPEDLAQSTSHFVTVNIKIP